MMYYLANPTGNITILANRGDADPVSEAAQLMCLEPAAEQVGFLSDGENGCDICLTMAGGEFCGNAALSAAAVCLYEKRDGEEDNSERTLRVRVSGEDQPVRIKIRRISGREYYGTVNMPKPVSVSEKEFVLEDDLFRFPVVSFRGIMHIICEPVGDGTERSPADSEWPFALTKEAAERAVTKWCADLNCAALGMMFVDPGCGNLTPLVYVRSSGTLFWESSCASGTSAAGAYYACLSGKAFEKEFSEPAGKLKIMAVPSGELYLSGTVKIEKIV